MSSLVYLADLDPGAVYFDRPLWWHTAGKTQTASGYGRKLTSARCVRLSDGRVRRVYVTCFSNNSTAWIILDGREFVIVDERIREAR